MNAFQHRLAHFREFDATLYRISIDSLFAQNAVRERLGLEFGHFSDANREIIDAYGVAMDWEANGLNDVARRAVFVVNGDGDITYSWVADDTKTEPDYDDVLDAINAATV